MSTRDKASLVLRQLERYGWIYTDVDHSYVQRVNFHDYAIRIIKSLISIEDDRKPEYQGYVYAIYNLAKAGIDQAGVALLQIAENTESLITGLKSLNANIKKYIDHLTRYNTVAEILDALLNDYYTNIVDKAYHRLMTSDNVAKFRPEIIERLEAHSRSSRYLDAAAKDVAQIREITVEQAREYVLSLLHEVIDAFRSMDDILEDINKKNTKYQQAAIGRARFMLSSSEDIRGQLKNILTFLNEQVDERGLGYNTVYELEEMDRLIRIFSWSYLDMDSLYTPPAERKVFSPEAIEIREVDAAIREAKRRQMLERMERTLNPARINDYVLNLLGERGEILAGSLEFSTVEEFIKLIYIRLYGQRMDMKYEIRTEHMKYVEKDGYRFRDFRIVRK